MAQSAKPLEVLVGTPGDGHKLGTIKDGTKSSLHLVVDAPYQSWAGEGTFVHVLALDGQFRPARGAKVYLDDQHIGTMDDSGTLAFRRAPAGKEKSAGGRLVIQHGTQYAWLDYSANSRTESFEQPAIYVYTDRGVYNPGQPIQVRAVAWTLRGEFRPLSDKDIDVELMDRRGRVVGGGVMRTDGWGIATLELPLPPNAKEGRMRLAASHGGERAEGDLRIERFVPPSIEIRHDLARFLTPAQSTLPLTINLGYFNGSKFNRGKLEVEVLVNGRSLHHEEHAVVGAGPHRYTLGADTMRAVHQGAHNASHVRIQITAHDELGRADAIRRDMRYEANPYKAVIELDRTRYAAGDRVNAMVRVVDLDGVPQRDRKVVLEVPSGQALERKTDEGGIARFTFAAPGLDADNDSSLAARIDDVRDPIATTTLPLEEPLPMRSSVEDTVVVEGIDVPVEVAFPLDVVPIERVVHGDVVDSSGTLIQSFTIPIAWEGKRRIAKGTFRAPSWGSMLLTLFCVGRKGADVGLLTDGQNLAVHPSNRALKVTLHGIPESVEPGAPLHVALDVRAADGQPLSAMLGASVTDAAVLSLLDPLERAPMDRFYNPDRKVLASTGAQTLTWPVVQRNWGADTYDIGWPPQFGFHTGRGPKNRQTWGTAYGSMWGDTIGDAFGAGGLGLSGIGEGGGGSGEGIGLGSIGTIGHGAGTGSARPRVVVRTNFSDTSLWLPRVVAKDGSASLDLHVPDAITNQKLSIVATDAQGRIGVLRQDIAVRQVLYGRAHFPAAMIAGDRIEVPVTVRNASADTQKVSVSLSSPSLRVHTATQTASVPPDSTTALYFDVEAPAAGTARYELVTDASGSSTNLRDVSRQELVVVPRGGSEVATQKGEAARGNPYRAVVERAAGDQKQVVRVQVAFPTVVPALQGMLALVQEGYFGADPAASRVLGAVAALEYLEKHKRVSVAQREEMRAWLGEVSTAILMGQNDDGGWGWYWDPSSNPYISAYALQSLLALRAAKLPVPAEALRRAASYLGNQLRPNDLYDVSAIAVWEGNHEQARLMATAEIFDVLSQVDECQREIACAAARARLEHRFADYLDTASPDLLTYAHAVSGLSHSQHSFSLDEAVRRLTRMRKETHWEPGWFHAYGGAIEASAVVLEVLGRLDPGVLESERNDAVRFLLSTRESWGGWHNARSTAFAIRALTNLEPAPTNDCGVLVVRVDGREVRRVPVNAGDPFHTASSLRAIELPSLAVGKHAVDVLYNGASRASVQVSVERWNGKSVAEPLRASTSVPDEMKLGERDELDINVVAPKKVGPLEVEQSLGAGLSLDRASLDELVSQGTILGWAATAEGVRLAVPPGGGHVRVKVEAVRPGKVTVPGARVHAAREPGTRGKAEDRVTTVRP